MNYKNCYILQFFLPQSMVSVAGNVCLWDCCEQQQRTAVIGATTGCSSGNLVQFCTPLWGTSYPYFRGTHKRRCIHPSMMTVIVLFFIKIKHSFEPPEGCSCKLASRDFPMITIVKYRSIFLRCNFPYNLLLKDLILTLCSRMGVWWIILQVG